MKKKGFAVLLTGLAATGKTTICKELVKILDSKYHVKTTIFNMDEYLKKEFGEKALTKPTSKELDEKIANSLKKRVNAGEKIIIDRGNSKHSIRELYKNTINKVIEVYVKCPMYLCVIRDFTRCLKGDIPRISFIYAKAFASLIIPGYNIPLQGVTKHYEIPHNPDVIIDTKNTKIEESVDSIIKTLAKKGFINL